MKDLTSEQELCCNTQEINDDPSSSNKKNPGYMWFNDNCLRPILDSKIYWRISSIDHYTISKVELCLLKP